MGGLSGSFGGHSDPAELHAEQTEADGPEVLEPGSVAGGDGEGGQHQESPEVGQGNKRNTAEKTPGQ